MHFLAAFPTLHCRQSSTPCTKPPFLKKQTHNLFFIQAVGLQEAGSQASDYSSNVCLLHKVSVGNTTLYLQPSHPACQPDSPPVLTPTTPRHQRHNHILMTLPVKSHFIYSWSALRTKKINFMLNHERAGSQLT